MFVIGDLMAIADAGSRNGGTHIRSPLVYGDMRCAAFAKRYAADAVLAEIDAHALAQADAFADSEPHGNPLWSLFSHNRLYGVVVSFLIIPEEPSPV